MKRRGKACLSVDGRVSGRGMAGTADVAADADGTEAGALPAVTVRIIPAKPTVRKSFTTRRRDT